MAFTGKKKTALTIGSIMHFFTVTENQVCAEYKIQVHVRSHCVFFLSLVPTAASRARVDAVNPCVTETLHRHTLAVKCLCNLHVSPRSAHAQLGGLL